MAWLLISCGPPPTYKTSLGIQVWDPAHHFKAEQVQQLVDVFLLQFKDHWPAAKAAKMMSQAHINFLDVHTYDSWGEMVAGTVDPGSLEIYVAGSGYTLPQSALGHELVHYLDFAITGTTDYTHASWGPDGIWTSLDEVSAQVQALEAEPAP